MNRFKAALAAIIAAAALAFAAPSPAAATEEVPGLCYAPAQHFSWTGGHRAANDPPPVTPPNGYWQANTDHEPHSGASVGLHYTANSNGYASWFYFVPAWRIACPRPANLVEDGERSERQIKCGQDFAEVVWDHWVTTFKLVGLDWVVDTRTNYPQHLSLELTEDEIAQLVELCTPVTEAPTLPPDTTVPPKSVPPDHTTAPPLPDETVPAGSLPPSFDTTPTVPPASPPAEVVPPVEEVVPVDTVAPATAAPAPTDVTLPVTGASDNAAQVAIGALLMLAGVSLLALTRRNRRA